MGFLKMNQQLIKLFYSIYNDRWKKNFRIYICTPYQNVNEKPDWEVKITQN